MPTSSRRRSCPTAGWYDPTESRSPAGAEILVEQNESFARFRATHHMLTDHIVTRSGDTAQVRANMQAMHLWNDAGNSAELQTHFVAGGVLRASAELTPDGWRLSELTMRPTWRTGATTRMFLPAHR